MRLIDGDALEREGWILQRTRQEDKHTMVFETKRPQDFPTVEERKKGKWGKNGECQFCGVQPWYENDIHTLSFCPNCGADMRGEKNETCGCGCAESGV